MQAINPELEDAELVKLSLAQPECFSYIIGRYKDKLQRYIRRLGAFNLEDSEDILQEVFLKVYKNLNGYEPELKFSSWIYRIAHNEAISHFRKRKARPEGYSISIDSPGLQLLASDLSLENRVDGLMRDEAVTAALLTLDERYRDILILKFFEEKSYNEISDIIKKPLGTVASLISRAKKDLKEALPEQWRET
ncbi:MAG: RNA polymerase sigma factor [Bacillota bacterium]